MKAIVFAVLLFGILLLGCTQSPPPTPPAAAVTPAPDGIATQDVLQHMDDMMKESGVGTSLGQKEMTQSQRDAMAEKSGSGGVVLGPNAFMRVQYDMKGSASIIERAGKKYLVFSDDFATRSGPRLVVRLSTSPAPSSIAALDASEHVLLHDVIDVMGYQEYELPADYAKYESVIVFCEPFRVIWGYAALK